MHVYGCISETVVETLTAADSFQFRSEIVTLVYKM